MDEKRNDNIVRMRRHFHLNAGIIIFLVILAYTLFFVVRYFAEDHVTAYEVQQGSLVQDDRYVGIAVRDEKVCTADAAGTISYYVSAGKRVGVRTLVYSLDTDGAMAGSSSSSGNASSYLTDSDFSSLGSSFTDFATSYNDMDFSSVYQLESRTNSELSDDRNSSALEDLQSASGDVSGLLLYKAHSPGIVEYYTDGYESLSADAVTRGLLEKASSYSKNDLENSRKVSAGDTVYKYIADENWELVIAVDDKTANTLEKMQSVKVTFDEDQNSAWASVSILDTSDGKLAVLSFTTSVERYAAERYLKVQLTLDNVSGLKIPNSSITEKTVYQVPKSYLSQGGDEDSYGLLVEDSSGKSTTFISPTVYSESGDYYYMAGDGLEEGDTLVQTDSSETYQVSSTSQLKGVFCINKGYAEFDPVDIIYQNNDYSIVSDDGSLKQYDHIALDAGKIKEGELVK